jgi:hypothetical protein
MYSQPCGDRLDAERHEELRLVARLVLFHAGDNGGSRLLRLRAIRPRGFGILTCFHQIE